MLKELESLADEEMDKKEKIMTELFGTYNKLAFPGAGFRCDYGFNIHFHGLAVVNYNVVMLDTSPINIGAGTFIGPGICLACSGHGMHPSQRSRVLTSAPITLGENVWLGANVTVCRWSVYWSGKHYRSRKCSYKGYTSGSNCSRSSM